MQRVRLNNLRSVVNFSWNIMIDMLLFYGFVTLDPFQLESLQTRCAVAKPMFGHLVQVVDRYVYPSVYVTNLVYSYLFGAQIVQTLDSDCIYQFYTRGKQWRVIYISFIGSHFVFFFLFAPLTSSLTHAHGHRGAKVCDQDSRFCATKHVSEEAVPKLYPRLLGQGFSCSAWRSDT